MDKIANLITELRNASAIGKDSVIFPYSKLSLSVAEALSRRGLVGAIVKKGKKLGKNLEIKLVYESGLPKIQGGKRLSRQSRRVYYGVGDIYPIRNGTGALFLSTTKGVLSGDEARKENIGGEALFEIW